MGKGTALSPSFHPFHPQGIQNSLNQSQHRRVYPQLLLREARADWMSVLLALSTLPPSPGSQGWGMENVLQTNFLFHPLGSLSPTDPGLEKCSGTVAPSSRT